MYTRIGKKWKYNYIYNKMKSQLFLEQMLLIITLIIFISLSILLYKNQASNLLDNIYKNYENTKKLYFIYHKEQIDNITSYYYVKNRYYGDFIYSK